jgi:hypothetical protein
VSALTKAAVATTAGRAAHLPVSRFGAMKGQVRPALGSARDQLDAAWDRVLPMIEQAREQLGPGLETAREKLTPALETAREQLRENVAPAVSEAVETALERSAPARAEARRRSELAFAALLGQPVTVGRPRRWPALLVSLLVGLGMGALVGAVVHRSTATGYSPAPFPDPLQQPGRHADAFGSPNSPAEGGFAEQPSDS